MTLSVALLLVGAIAVVVGLFASRLSPALAKMRLWILIAGVAFLVLGAALDPDVASGFRSGLRGD